MRMGASGVCVLRACLGEGGQEEEGTTGRTTNRGTGDRRRGLLGSWACDGLGSEQRKRGSVVRDGARGWGEERDVRVSSRGLCVSECADGRWAARGHVDLGVDILQVGSWYCGSVRLTASCRPRTSPLRARATRICVGSGPRPLLGGRALCCLFQEAGRVIQSTRLRRYPVNVLARGGFLRVAQT